MKKSLFLLGELFVLAIGFMIGLPYTLLAADTEVPMRGSEIKLFASCDDLQDMPFIRPGQTLSGEDGWDLLSGHHTPNFSCAWRQQDAARCQRLGHQVTGGQWEPCYEMTDISHGPGRQQQTRKAAEAAVLNEPLSSQAAEVLIRDSRLAESQYSNVVISKRSDNSPIDWQFQMYVFTPAEWWLPQASRVYVTYRFIPPGSTPESVQAAKKASPPVPADEAIVTFFLELLKPAECIISTQDCIARDMQRSLQNMDGVGEHFRDLQRQGEEAIRRMEEQLREIELQMKSGLSG